ncbi:MAG: hypothetical protein QOJ89_504, partial [bacterium]
MLGAMRHLWSLPLAALALAFGGCTRTIDSEKAERTITKSVSSRTGSKITKVNCPSGKTAGKGETFRCTVVAADGESGSVVVTETDDQGTVRVRVPYRDSAATERAMATKLTRRGGRPVGVDCPDLIPIRAGIRFTCIMDSEGRRGRIEARQIDAAGKV